MESTTLDDDGYRKTEFNIEVQDRVVGKGEFQIAMASTSSPSGQDVIETEYCIERSAGRKSETLAAWNAASLIIVQGRLLRPPPPSPRSPRLPARPHEPRIRPHRRIRQRHRDLSKRRESGQPAHVYGNRGV